MLQTLLYEKITTNIIMPYIELDPLVFIQAWGLTYHEAAQYLGVKPRQIQHYVSRDSKPSEAVRKAAAYCSMVWMLKGRSPKHPELIKNLV